MNRQKGKITTMKKLLLATAALIALPVMAHAQPQPTPGFYIGGEGGVNWMFNTTANVPGFGGAVNIYPATGWAAGGMVGYDFVGPRIELEGVYRSNNGRAPGNFGNTSGKVEQVSAMVNVLYDFIPGATITPYIGAGAGIAFADSAINGCSYHDRHVDSPGKNIGPIRRLVDNWIYCQKHEIHSRVEHNRPHPGNGCTNCRGCRGVFRNR